MTKKFIQSCRMEIISARVEQVLLGPFPNNFPRCSGDMCNFSGMFWMKSVGSTLSQILIIVTLQGDLS